MAERFTYEHAGKTYSGTYEIRSKMVHVTTEFGSKSTQLGGMQPATLARLSAGELIRESNGA
jgi:hypothetical protein